MNVESKVLSRLNAALEQQPFDELYKAINEEDASISIMRLRTLAEKGNMKAQYALGNRYDEGLGARKNQKEASKWYLLAAKQGMKEAQLEIGLMYSQGKGVRKSHRQAVKWFLNAARQRDEIARLILNLDYSIFDVYVDPELFNR